MSFLNKTYTLEKDENIKEFMEYFSRNPTDQTDQLTNPDDQIKVLLNFKPSNTLKKDGDEYILTMTTPGDGKKDPKFKDGVEFDEEVAPGIVGKSKFTFEGNVVTQSQTFGDCLSLIYRREYSDDELVVVVTSNKWDGTARSYFKAA